jgi:hypothetical protein
MPASVTTNVAGVDLFAAYDAILTATPEIPAHPHLYGTRVHDNAGGEWVFGKVGASALISRAEASTLGQTFDDATPMLRGTGVLIAGRRLGVYQGAATLSAGMAAWFLLSGSGKLKVGGSCLPNVPLYTTDTSGVVDDLTASTSQFLLRAIYATETNSGTTASVVNAILTFPTIAPILTALP